MMITMMAFTWKIGSNVSVHLSESCSKIMEYPGFTIFHGWCIFSNSALGKHLQERSGYLQADKTEVIVNQLGHVTCTEKTETKQSLLSTWSSNPKIQVHTLSQVLITTGGSSPGQCRVACILQMGGRGFILKCYDSSDAPQQWGGQLWVKGYQELMGREGTWNWRKVDEFTCSHNYPNSQVLGKGCVGHEETHLAGYRKNDVIRGNPGFSWDEAEKCVFEKEVPNFWKFLGSRAEPIYQRT